MTNPLLRFDPPGANNAEARAWETVHQAFLEREPVQRASRRIWVGLAIAVLAAAAVGLLSPQGRAVVDRVRERVGIKNAAPALFSLPAPGQLLVVSEAGVWVVQQDGSKRLLPGYRDASWSPRGRFIVAIRRNELAALEPNGTVRWTLARPVVNSARWAGTATDTRIAYTDRTGLREVAGDGTGDRLLAAAARGPIAWRPGGGFVLAYATHNQLVVRDTAAEHILWTAKLDRTAFPTDLEWSDDGKRLLALSPNKLRLYDATGTPLRSTQGEFTAATFRPGTHSIAAARTNGRQSSVATLGGDSFFSGPGSIDGLTASPDGKWLLIAWPTANQWLLVNPHADARTIHAIANVPSQFRSLTFPRAAEWCCRR